MKKHYLMAPGPSMIPERVLLEMAKPIIHHRTPQFEKILTEVRSGLKELFQTKNEVLLFASVGSGAMEASVVNFFSPGDEVIVVVSGKFGERWRDQAKVFGLKVIEHNIEWGQAVDLKAFEKLLKDYPKAKGVFCQACETSTGVSHPIEKMGQLIKKRDQTLFLVDAITALGIYEIKADAWGLDVVVSGSQKALMLPPGLSLLSVSEKALKFNKKSTLPKYYFNIAEELKTLQKNQTHFTPAISLIQGLKISLEMMKDEGFQNIFKRHQKLAKATREAVKALGLKLFSESPSDSITAVTAPSKIDGEKIVSHMQDKYGITIIGGQDKLKGQVFRLGHMGYCSEFDVITMISGLELTLNDLGYSLELGHGVSAALETFAR